MQLTVPVLPKALPVLPGIGLADRLGQGIVANRRDGGWCLAQQGVAGRDLVRPVWKFVVQGPLAACTHRCPG
ncbi:hypothetical protein D3C81_1373840 [compost metagenome]